MSESDGRKLRKSRNPRRRLGVYGAISEVPDHHRISAARGSYEGRDVWAEWRRDADEASGRAQHNIERIERLWREYADENSFHHALAEPADIDGFAAGLLEGRTAKTAYFRYFAYLAQFYHWLARNPKHPAVRYDPAVMAAANYEATRKLWDAKNAKTAASAEGKRRRKAAKAAETTDGGD